MKEIETDRTMDGDGLSLRHWYKDCDGDRGLVVQSLSTTLARSRVHS